VPKTRTPRELLLAALERRRLTGFSASEEMAWVLFPPQRAGGNTLTVLHVPSVNRFRVVSSQTQDWFTSPASTIGDFRSCDAAAACVEDALHAEDTQNGALPKDGAISVS
jgi:hypothetical protein